MADQGRAGFFKRKRGLPRGSVLEFSAERLTHVVYKHQGDRYTLLSVNNDTDPPTTEKVKEGIPFSSVEDMMSSSGDEVRYIILDKRVKLGPSGDLMVVSTPEAATSQEGARELDVQRTAAPKRGDAPEKDQVDDMFADNPSATKKAKNAKPDEPTEPTDASDEDIAAAVSAAAAIVATSEDPPPTAPDPVPASSSTDSPTIEGNPLDYMDVLKKRLTDLQGAHSRVTNEWLNTSDFTARPNTDILEEMIRETMANIDELEAERKALAEAEVARLKNAGASPDLVNAQEQDNALREQELAVQGEDTEQQVKTAMDVNETPEAKLAGGALDGQTTSRNAAANADAGSMANAAGAMDVEAVQTAQPKEGATNDPEHPEDAKMTDKTKDGSEVLKGSDTGEQMAAPIDKDVGGHIDSVAASGNAMMEVEKSMGIVHGKDVAMDTAASDARLAEEAKTDAFIEQAQRQPAQDPEAMETGATPTAKDVEEEMDFNAVLERTLSNLDKAGVDFSSEGGEREKQLALVRKEVTASLHVLSRSVDVQRMEPPSVAEQVKGAAQIAAGELAREGAVGSLPIFHPDDVMRKVTGIQSDLADTMSMEERNTRLAQMKPWWNEFRMTRTTQGMAEMETMPTFIIKSPTGTVQTGSKLREDVSQTTSQFFYFMFWAMRAKMNNMHKATNWDDLYRYSAAMGYNDLTQAQINWLVTGDANGDLNSVDYSGIAFNEDVLEVDSVRMSPLIKFNQTEVDVLHRAVSGYPMPGQEPPGKNVSPSAAPAGVRREYKVVDGKLVSVVASLGGFGDVGAGTLAGVPNKVTNIPDPRFSERGGRQVKNVRVVTVRNPDYVPTDKDSKEFLHKSDGPAKNTTDAFLQEEVADVGAGAKEVNAQIEKAEADRLTAALPFKLYAPLHPQACDRYLGERNYARLGLEPAKYFKSYVKQPFDVTQVDQQLNWNRFVMATYGPMLYAFVTDAALQRATPIFDMTTPAAVTLEFMELNELIEELKRYQMKSADRADRVGDSGNAQSPIENHLENFFKDRDAMTAEKFDDSNAVVIALPDDGPPDIDPSGGGGGGGGDDPPVPPPRPGGDGGGGTPLVTKVDRQFQSSSQVFVGARDMDEGIRRSTPHHLVSPYNQAPPAHQSTSIEPVEDRRSKMFKLLNGGKMRR